MKCPECSKEMKRVQVTWFTRLAAWETFRCVDGCNKLWGNFGTEDQPRLVSPNNASARGESVGDHIEHTLSRMSAN